MSNYNIPELPLGYELETKAVLKQVNLAGRKLAELNYYINSSLVDLFLNVGKW